MLAKVLRQKNFPYYGFNKVDIVIGIFQFTEFKYFIENIWFWTVGNVIHEDVSQIGFFLTLTSPHLSLLAVILENWLGWTEILVLINL